jgi:hypothetical protein
MNSPLLDVAKPGRPAFDDTATDRASRAMDATEPACTSALALEPVNDPSRLVSAEELHGLEDIVPHHIEI